MKIGYKKMISTDITWLLEIYPSEEQLSLMITGLACGILFACSTELEEDGDRFGDYLQQALINKH